MTEIPDAAANVSDSGRDSVSTLQTWRGHLSSRWPESIALAIFTAILSSAILHHEPWADEAHAWQLSRSLSLSSLFRTYIRYESTPGLWHFLLWLLIRAHVSFSGLHWICGAVAAAAASLLLFRSPFPLYLRLILPFGYFLLFQYGVVARSYVLVPPLLFLIALVWKRNSTWVAICLGLLANVSLHAAVISGGLAIVYLIRRPGGTANANSSTRRMGTWALIVFAFYAFAIWTAWPPADLPLGHFRGDSRPFLLFAVVSLTWAVCEPWIASTLIWIGIASCLRARRSLLYLLPVLFFAVFSGAVYAQFWHMGLLVPLIIAIFWITWPEQGAERGSYEMVGQISLFCMTAVQLLWSGYALHYDHYHDYSGNPAAAEFLKPFVRENATIAVTFVGQDADQTFNAVGILPYFDSNIFANWPDSFWWWSNRNSTEQRFNALLPSHPRIVLVETHPLHPLDPVDFDQPKIQRILLAGYKLTNSFCGSVPERLELVITSCHLVFQPEQDAHSARSNSTGNEDRQPPPGK